MTTTWTAPQSGWYQFGDGEPRLLTGAEADALGLPESPGGTGTATVVRLDSAAEPFGFVPAEAEVLLERS